MSGGVPWTRRWAARVVEIRKVGGGVRSGYLIADGLVLTAGHGLDLGDEVRVRGASGGEWSGGSVAWRSTLDAALLTVPGLRVPATSLRWGELTGRDPVSIRAYGFPRADGNDLAPVHGLAQPDGASRRGLLRIDLTGPIPLDAASWSGMSGAAVLDTDDNLLGVLIHIPAAWNADRIHAVPVAALLADARFRELVGSVEAFPVDDDCPLIRPAYEDLEWDADDVSISEPLKAKYAVVPFVPDGREDVLAELLGWCGHDRPLAVRSLTGPAGTGKSRLAAEVCRRLGPDWHAGLAVDPATNGAAWGDWSPSRPTLIVVDYAEDPKWRDPFRRIFTRLRELRRDKQLAAPVRILLISRHPVFSGLDDESGTLSTMLQAEHNRGLALPLLNLTPEIREAHLDHAFAAFSARSDAEPIRPDAGHDRPLLIHVAALLGAMGIDTTHLSGMELLDRLLARESLRWRDRLAVDHDDHAWQAVCLATLTAPTVADARDLLTAIPAWADRPFAARDAAAKAIFRLYPDSPPSTDTKRERIAPVEPDLIAEHLIARTVDLQEILARIQTHEKTTAAHHGRLLQIMDLTADHYPEVAEDYRARRDASVRALLGGLAGDEPLPELLATHLRRLYRAVATQVNADGDNRPAMLLAAALEAFTFDAGVAAAAAELTEHDSIDPDFRLDRLQRIAIEHAIDHFMWLVRSSAEASDLPRAVHLCARLVIIMNNLGFDEALTIDICELAFAYARMSPDIDRWDLAELSDAHCCALYLNERDEAALTAAEEAVALWRCVPDADERLGQAINFLAVCHNKLGHHAAALNTASSAVEVWQRIPPGPDPMGCRAQTFTQLAVAQHGLLHFNEATEAAAQAVVHWREAATSAPVLEHDLAAGLMLTADFDPDPSTALAAATEAVGILRRLSTYDPEPLEEMLAEAEGIVAGLEEGG